MVYPLKKNHVEKHWQTHTHTLSHGRPTCSQSVSATRSIIVPISRNSPEYFTYAQAQSDSSAMPITRLASTAKVLSPMKPVTPDTK